MLPLLQDGFEIDGVDASKHMLDALYKKADKLGLKPNVWRDYAKNIGSDKKYNLIFIPSGSFGLIPSLKTASDLLAVFYSILNKDGVLIFEAETLKAMPNQFGTPHSFSKVVNGGGVAKDFRCHYLFDRRP